MEGEVDEWRGISEMKKRRTMEEWKRWGKRRVERSENLRNKV